MNANADESVSRAVPVPILDAMVALKQGRATSDEQRAAYALLVKAMRGESIRPEHAPA